jgi:hypothetical protein
VECGACPSSDGRLSSDPATSDWRKEAAHRHYMEPVVELALNWREGQLELCHM